MSDYAWGIRLDDEGDEPTAHVVDFEAGETALCGVTAVLRLDAEESLPVCEECKTQALTSGILTERNTTDSGQSMVNQNQVQEHEQDQELFN